MPGHALQGALLLTLAPAEPRFEIGEPIWVVGRIENRGSQAYSLGMENGLQLRDSEIVVQVVDRSGRRCPDPFRYPPSDIASNQYTGVLVPPGATGEFRIDLAKYAWLEGPGTYTVRLWAPLSADGLAPSKETGWAETRVKVVRASDPARVVAAQPRSVNEHHVDEAGDLSNEWRMRLSSYDGLGHPQYVPILERLAASSTTRTSGVANWNVAQWYLSSADQRALYGLAACPCLEATEALFRLYDLLSDPELRSGVAAQILVRIPGAQWQNAWFVEHAWDTRFDAMARDRARAALRGSTAGVGWGPAYAWGADVLARIGEGQDGLLLAQAMERALGGGAPDLDGGEAGRFGVIWRLQNALSRHPAPLIDLDEQAEVVLALQAWDGHSGDPPPGWEDTLSVALASPNPSVVAVALEKLPPKLPTALVDAVLLLVGSPDWRVSLLAQRAFARPADEQAAREALLAAVPEATQNRAVAMFAILQGYLPLDDWLELLLTKLSSEPLNVELARLLLRGLGACPYVPFAIGAPAPGEIPTLRAAWMTALEHRRDELRRGPLPIEAGVTDPALVPAEYWCTLPTGEVWPKR